MMKDFVRLYAILLVAILCIRCTNNFEDINENPNEPETVETSQLLTSALFKSE